MCGIFGFATVPGNGDGILRAMASQQLHRGPDSEGFAQAGPFGIGIRRLSVIDLVTGNQPIHNEDGTLTIVCNGEIYNYRELRAELEGRGHRFVTQSDVETVIHLYEESGIDCLRRLNGMFGLAILDRRRRRLFVARDRLGIKPIYVAQAGGGVIFASELRSLLATGLVGRDLDWDALSEFLDRMYIDTPRSPFREIRKLRPGHWLEIDERGTARERAFWRLSDPPAEPLPASEGEARERLTALLEDSCRLELRADVPVCGFLSGGIDSSAVVAFAARQTPLPLKTYHVVFENAVHKMDERHLARMVAERYGTDHQEVTVTRGDFKRLMPRLLWHLEEPFGDLAAIPTFIISEMARREVTVCLNGSGGDELFAGYSHHGWPAMLKQAVLGGLDHVGIESWLRAKLGKANNAAMWKALFPQYREPSVRAGGCGTAARRFPGDPVNRVLARDIDGYLQSNVLFLLDKVAMAVSLEGRVPLLDHRLVELAAHLPSRWKTWGGEKKIIFKRLLEPHLPREVLYRKKEGFGAPLADWLDPETDGMLRRIIESGLLRKQGLLTVERQSLSLLQPWDLWRTACLEVWFRIFSEFPADPRNATLADFV